MLSELHQRILGRDPELAVQPARRARPGRAAGHPAARDGGIRGPRRGTRAADRGARPHPRVAIIEGMPGVGKTALAVRAARLASGQYPDGTLYLNLHSHDPGSPSLDPAEALHRLLQMLSVPAAQIPETIGERTRCGGPT